MPLFMNFIKLITFVLGNIVDKLLITELFIFR